MPVTQWNDAEDEALQGLPLAAQLLYLRGLRRWMDYRTGVVGRSRRISWQMLREVLYVEPHKGLQDSGSPHESKVRRLVVWLVKAGLVVERGDGEWLVFFLPLAARDYSEPNKADRNPTGTRQGEGDTSRASSGKDSETIPDRNPTGLSTGIPDTPPESGIRISHTAAHSSVSDIAGARDRRERAKTIADALSRADVLVTSESVVMLQWIDRGLSLDFLLECTSIARRKKPGQPIPVNFLACIVDDHVTGGTSGVPEWAQIPRDDDLLWSWAKKHGYSNPGQRTHGQYRALLRGEVEKRALLVERGEVE